MHLALALFLSACVSFSRADDLNIPAKAIATGAFETLVALLTKAKLVETLSGPGPFTVFAPTDKAFAKLNAAVFSCLQEDAYEAELIAVLKYHVTNGEFAFSTLKNEQKVTTLEGSDSTVTIAGTVKINEATVISLDYSATNGIIHAIDEVLIPTGNAAVKALIDTCSIRKDIPGTAIFNNNVPYLVSLLTDADLVETLSGPGPFTVFAPTDDAFGKLEYAFAICLQQDRNKFALTELLKYHVTSGKVASSTLKNEQKVKTLEGSDATVAITGTTVKINEATITTPDVYATNGIIHVIDEVLIPTDSPAVKALMDQCKSASAILGVTIPLIGMVAAVVAIL